MPLPFITGVAEGMTRGKQAQTESELRRKQLAYESMLRRQEKSVPTQLAPEMADYYRKLAEQQAIDITAQKQEQVGAQELGFLPPNEQLLKKYRPIISIAKHLPPERQEKIRNLFVTQLGGTPDEIALQRFRDVVLNKITELQKRGLKASYINGRLRIQPIKEEKERQGILSKEELLNLFELSDNPSESEEMLRNLIDTGFLDKAQAADLWDSKFKK